MTASLTREAAQDIINALRRGTVPGQGLHHLNVQEVKDTIGLSPGEEAEIEAVTF